MKRSYELMSKGVQGAANLSNDFFKMWIGNRKSINHKT